MKYGHLNEYEKANFKKYKIKILYQTKNKKNRNN